jgi:hypothetical protein
LKDGLLDESRYRIGDLSRPRSLFWISDIIANPDEIHDHIREDGIEVYSKRFKRSGGGAELKTVLVGMRDTATRVVITSFWCDSRYLSGCVKLPAIYIQHQ